MFVDKALVNIATVVVDITPLQAIQIAGTKKELARTLQKTSDLSKTGNFENSRVMLCTNAHLHRHGNEPNFRYQIQGSSREVSQIISLLELGETKLFKFQRPNFNTATPQTSSTTQDIA
ncbi:MAG: hypothetical protein WDN47_00860 [Candidatus Doudnabacteria bacterium]